ncbi:alpha-1,3/1,6-mannosyltransferase ALG2 [Belonocnema kinseyi]|uniref:alpha-1,3/1,6-mannosyltransferase ALG2 n=1 Tax=Belonocnema kinseyi TaxID=2817044 RepID=UPI00143DF1B3|nr:alpha-1,3/1,6-mannosyltransferase ALG2 [Belonocnema kinseyi]
MVRITFLHPDLGVGGAERLVVDAALALKNKGHEVKFVTSHHDPDHCFIETKDGTIPVTVYGDWLPRNIFGKFFAACAYIRMIYAALCIIFLEELPEIVFCDIVSVCIPILRLRIPHVLFYCHFPDQLLSSRGGQWKSIYRAVLNFMEEFTTGRAHKVLVNSRFTQEVFKKTFKRLNIQTEVLYPSVNTDYFDKARILPLERALDRKLPDNSCILLSINRYERKKNLSLCIEALAQLKNTLSDEEYEKIYLIMAGGYDKRVEENVEHHLELIGLADELQVTEKIIFLRSPSDLDKVSILNHSDIVIYTPPNEHFGIVPLEAMYVGKPVVAQNSGGPTESVENSVTGFLAEPSAQDFADKIASLVRDKEMRIQFGKAGRERFMKNFSFEAFSTQLNATVENLLENNKAK